jgi:hypothetical protein
MKIAPTCLLGGALVAGALSISRDASALGPVGIEVGAKVGAGTNPTGDSLNPFGFGLGARAGVSIFNIYAGLSFMYYFGGSATLPESTDKRSGKSVLYGFEGGYDFNIVNVVIIRPQLGIGVYNGNFHGGGFTTDTADGRNLYLEPGVTGIVPLGFWFVGADANALFLPGQSGSSAGFTFHGQIGLKF